MVTAQAEFTTTFSYRTEMQIPYRNSSAWGVFLLLQESSREIYVYIRHQALPRSAFLYPIPKSIWQCLEAFAMSGGFFCCFCCTPMANGGSQARGVIGATAASLHHSYSNARSLTH